MHFRLNNQSWFARISGGFLYNSGRTLTYAALGTVFGLAGMGFAPGGAQQWVSIIIGSVMILAVLIPRLGVAGNKISTLTDSISGLLKKPFVRLFRMRTYGSLFIIGLLNGFLPCGLVYIALAGALVMSHVYEGTLYMVAFGIGTIPMMLAIAIAGNILSLETQEKTFQSNTCVYYIIGSIIHPQRSQPRNTLPEPKTKPEG